MPVPVGLLTVYRLTAHNPVSGKLMSLYDELHSSEELMPKVIVLAMGCVFMAFGRWLHRNPQRLAPQSWPGANSGVINDVAKFMGIAFVFVGASSALFALLASLVGALAQVVVLPISVLITWICFRSKRQLK